jgi:predicted enzyme related to lactoylglutathione lyase
MPHIPQQDWTPQDVVLRHREVFCQACVLAFLRGYRSSERHSNERLLTPPQKPHAMDQTNRIIYVEFHSTDLEKTKGFFEKVFGWTFTDYGPDYTSFVDGQLAGGFFRSDKHASYAAGSPLVVIFHPRLEEALARVAEHGGRITQQIFAYPGGRRFHFTEPSGNELSVCSDP